MSSHWVTTGTGSRKFDFLDMQSSDLNYKDIARALSRTNRFGGHGVYPYNVAQHSILVMFLILLNAKLMSVFDLSQPDQSKRYREIERDIVNPKTYANRLARLALVHDMPEAYMGDIPTPLKTLLPEFRVLEKRLENLVHSTFGLDDVTSADMELLHLADAQACLIERDFLFPDRTPELAWSPAFEAKHPGLKLEDFFGTIMNPHIAETTYLDWIERVFPWLVRDSNVH